MLTRRRPRRSTPGASALRLVTMATLAALPSVLLVGFAGPAHAAAVTDPDPSAPPTTSATSSPSAAGAASAGTPPVADGVVVGSGSYAPTPPDTITDSADVQKTLNQHLYIDPSQKGKPVPTNQWWTDLLVSKFSGDMWANPLVSSTSAAGTKVSYPTAWNADGTSMKVEDGVTVSGDVTPTPDGSDEVLADFENGLPAGWTTTGSAFTTSSGVGAGQSDASGWLGHGYLTSWGAKNGDGATGTITSTPFTVDHSHLTFQIAGGNHPDQEAVQLLVGGKVVETTTGTNAEQLQWADWDVSAFAGQQAQLRVVDTLNAGWAHVMVDQLMLTDQPASAQQRYSTVFSATESDALRWGDYNVSWRMPQAGSGGQYMDVTSVQGDPYEWFEYHGETPRLTLEAGATITDGDGDPISFPFTGDEFEIHQNGHVLGVHVADGTRFTRTGTVLEAASGSYLVLSAMPKDGLSLDQLHEYAFAVPRDTRMDYTYDHDKGRVEERWTVTTDALQGSNHDTVQGWLQHQYTDATTNLHFTGAEYATPRGLMKTTIGHDDAVLDYAFSGITPIGATPDTGNADFTAEMHKYISDYSSVKWTGGDTYWDGKNLLQLAEYMTAAKQLGDVDDEQKLQTTLEGALSDWYTYTNGEKQDFFAMYPTWKALIGFADSYGSAQLNDQMFHYGYFATATALLGQVDPSWAKRYEGMATLVTNEYADGDRDDPQFPHLRTFGVWEGHSNAGGFSSAQGNNQESSSEAIQSEAGLFLLGTVLGNKDMQATGAMEYVTERAAVRDYYQNVHGNTASSSYDGNGAFPSGYQHAQVGILQDVGDTYATYFSGDPGWIYGIQWMPTAPWFDYFGWDPKFSQSIMQQMMTERPQVLGKGVASDNAAHIQMLTKKWYGVGTYGSVVITKDQTAAIGELEDAIRAAERNDPGYVTAKTAANPLYDAASDTLYVSTDSTGKVVFPAKYWTPATLPASLVPAALSGADADKQPKDWPTQSPLLPYLSTNYTPDQATIKRLYSVDFSHYTPGTDTAQAAAVFSDMGDALGEVDLGFLAQYDPATYADIHEALWKAKDPAVTGKSMAGMVYYQGMSNLAVGTEVTTRHTSDPLSQVFRDAKGTYSYVLDNPDDVQRSYDVYDGSTVIGSIAVPANTQITSHLDAHLSRIVVRTAGDPTTVVPGSAPTFTATGYDQYGATVALSGVDWSATVGSISSDGVYHATTKADKVTVTATVGAVHASTSFRVAPAPTLTNITVTPGFDRLVVGTPQRFSAAGVDQYGDAIALPSAVTWSYTGPGTIASDGTLTTSAPGAGSVVATIAGSSTATHGVAGSAVAASVARIPDAALHATATASSSLSSKPSMAVDGDSTTRWESVHGVDDVDYTVDLGRETDISHVAINWENAAASEYDLQLADSANGPWRTVKDVTKSSSAPDDLAVTDTARYVRMHGISRITDYGYSIWDFHVFGTPAASAITPTTVLVAPGAVNVLPGGTTHLGAYAFDGAGNGGSVSGPGTADTAVWTIDGGGSVDTDGVVTAAETAGVTATVSATVGGAFGQGTVSTVANTSDPSTGPATGNDGGGSDGASQDVAVGKTVTTSSNERGDLSGDQAVDGNGSTRWSSAAKDGEWISVDLGASIPIDRVELDWEGAYAKSYQLEVRDSTDEPWRTVVDDTAATGGVDSHDLTGVSARFVRMLGGTRATAYGYSLYAFKVFSTQGAPTPDLARGHTATSSSNESSSVGPANAVDGDGTSRWASGHSDDQWLDVDLGAQHQLHSATIDWEGAFGRDYRIEARNSTTDEWTTIATVTGGDGGTDVVDIAGTWQQVRLQGVHRATPYGYSLYTFTVR